MDFLMIQVTQENEKGSEMAGVFHSYMMYSDKIFGRDYQFYSVADQQVDWYDVHW